MCVICIKPENTKFPTEDRMRDMFASNPDGAGFMFVRNKKVIIRKGFMKFKHFMKALRQEEVEDKDIVVMHFRIATAGSVSGKNCHPFPIAESLTELRAQRLETDLAMAHNGIIDYEADKKNDLSDTMSFVRDILSEKSIRNNIFEPSVYSLIEMSVGYSKIVFLDKTKRFCLLGNWAKDTFENDGLYYSNLLFKTHYSTSRHGGKVIYLSDRKDSKNDEVLDTKRKTLPTTYCETVYPIKDKDLDKDAYENKSFADNQANSSIRVDYDDTNCPYCGYPIGSPRQLCCGKCGKMFDRNMDA